MSKVTAIKSAETITPQTLLHMAMERVEEFKPTKMVIIMLDDRDNAYTSKIMQSGMRRSEVAALLEHTKLVELFGIGIT